jgi:cytochrome c peroxidase
LERRAGDLNIEVIGNGVSSRALLPIEDLGKALFEDTNLSEPAGQGCVSCHHPDAGFADPDQELPVSEGVIAGRFGNRNSPSAAYAFLFPEFNASKSTGGQFWDGRAANLVEQAKGPFLNPVEMNNPDKATVVAKVQAATYASLFEAEFGPGAFADVETAYHNIAVAIAAYEASSEVNPFTSKFDYVQAGLAEFTPQEAAGEKLFSGRGKCAHCHSDSASKNNPVSFTDFDYHNLGLPTNTAFPEFFPPGFVDNGLGGVSGDPRENGLFKTPHLRNIAMTPPYMHNGVLATLKDVVHFYNTRDVAGEWPAPEVDENISSSFLGDLGLTSAEEDDIVAYMLTFTDGYQP